jgi:hypothetical protein
VRAVEIFQRPAATAGFRQAESHISEFTGFRDGNGHVHGVAAFHVTLVIGGIKRGLERDVIVETLFFRVVNATRDSKGHKGNGIFIILRAFGPLVKSDRRKLQFQIGSG